MQIKLYNFAKKSNSTARPGNTALVATVDANIKDNCSLMNPVLLLDYGHNDFNYIYISSFGGRYYFVDDIVLNHGLIEVQCSVDVLATYKTEIGSTDMYITRASASYTGTITDNLYAIKNAPTINVIDKNFGWSYAGFDNGYYVLGVQGASDAAANNVIYYQLTPAKLRTLLYGFYANTGSSWWSNTARGVINALNKISDFIVCCRWYPFAFTVKSGGDKDVWIGSYHSTVSAGVLDDYPNFGYQVNFTLTNHPQASSRGSYLNYAPYSRYILNNRLIGNVVLPPEICVGKTVYCSFTPDFTTGEAEIVLYTSTPNIGTTPFYVTHVPFGVDVGLSGANVNIGGLIGNTAGTVANIAAGNYLGAMASIGNAVVDAAPDPGTTHTAGGFLSAIASEVMIRCIHYNAADDDNANHGRPYCKIAKPQNLTGYIMAENPHVVTLGTDTETNMINSMIEAGIYYE